MHSSNIQQEKQARIQARLIPGTEPGSQKQTIMPSPNQEDIAKATRAKNFMRRMQRKSTQDRHYNQKGTLVLKRSKYRCSSNCTNLDNANNHQNTKYYENNYNNKGSITWYIEPPKLKNYYRLKQKTSTKLKQRTGKHNNSSITLSRQWDIADDKEKQRQKSKPIKTTESYLQSSIEPGLYNWLDKNDQKSFIGEYCNFNDHLNINNDNDNSLLSIKSTICDFTINNIKDNNIVDNTINNIINKKPTKINNNYYYLLSDDEGTMMAETSVDVEDFNSANEEIGEETGYETGEESIVEDDDKGDDKGDEASTASKFTPVVNKKTKNKIAILLEKAKGVKTEDIKPMESPREEKTENNEEAESRFKEKKGKNKTSFSNATNDTTNNISLFNDRSNKFIPSKMPNFKGWTPKSKGKKRTEDEDDCDEDEESYQNDNDIDLGINIRVDLQKKKKKSINNVRLFYAIFSALKIAHPQLYVTPIEEEDDIEELGVATQTPTNEKDLEKYLEEPTMSRQGIFTARIRFRGTVPFFVIMNNSGLRAWLREESISLELNCIPSVKLANAGFFVNTHPRDSLIQIQTERILQLLPDHNQPPFMTYKSKVWNSNNISCHVLMVKTASYDTNEISAMFESIEESNSAHYISWEDWESLSLKRQNTIINTQNKYHTRYASLILSDLYDNDEIVMGEGVDVNTMTEEEHSRLSLTITEFLETKYTMMVNNQMVPIAEMVFPPINGTREIMIERSNKKLAIQWCKKLHCDLYVNMSLEAAKITFEDYNDIGLAAQNKNNLWTPNKLNNIIAEEEIYVDESKRGKKRSKTTNDKTYAKAATQTIQKQEEHKPTATNSTVTNVATNPSVTVERIPMQSITSMKENAALVERLTAMEIRQEQNEIKLSVISKLVEEQIVEMDTIKTGMNNNNNMVNLVLADLTTLMTSVHSNFSIVNAKLDAQGSSNKENDTTSKKRQATEELDPSAKDLEYQRHLEAQQQLSEAEKQKNNGENQSKSPSKSFLGDLSNILNGSF